MSVLCARLRASAFGTRKGTKMTDQEKIALITKIVETQIENNEDDEGDKHLASADYALEAIDAVLIGNTSNAILRQFTEGN
jgi:hypothetical protein